MSRFAPVADVFRRRLPSRHNPKTMTVMEHLTELRYRIIVSLIAIGVGGIVVFAFYEQVFSFLIRPYCESINTPQADCKLLQTGPLDGFAIRLRIALYGGIMLATPGLFYQLWRFIVPGLNANEKKYAYPFVISSVLLFTLGAVVAWFTFPKALNFLQTIGGTHLETFYMPQPYIKLLLLTVLAFGFTFEFPVLLVSLELAGVVTAEKLSSWRRPAIVIIVAVAALVTPSQDPISLFAMAIPMYLFYEASIAIGRLIRR